jgi:benzoyl-CoA reductase/2-hydroxyglutaryl-CoA dehydratase subunit BcrC/BadD/HgdB
MHEVVHVLEEWAGVAFSEKKVEKLIKKYQEKYTH